MENLCIIFVTKFEILYSKDILIFYDVYSAMSPQREVLEFLRNQVDNSTYNTLLRPKKNYKDIIYVAVMMQMNSLRSLVYIILSLRTIIYVYHISSNKRRPRINPALP